MVNMMLAPSWFFGYNVFLEAVFAIITIILGIYAIRIYLLTNQEQVKLFSISFFASLSHIS